MPGCGHKTVKCSECGTVISNCRCISKDKPVFYEICKKCKERSYGRKDPGNPKRTLSVRK